MKTLATLLFIASAALAQDIRVLTFNIRYDNPGDGRDAWNFRRETVAKVIADADISGLQEVKPQQRSWLREKLAGFTITGIGREKDDTDEAVPIVFRNERFELVKTGTFWLSETPEVIASKSWDSSLPRICTWAVLKDKTDGKSLAVFNAHLDHKGSEARDKGIAVVLERMASVGVPAVLLGDFNCTAGSPPIRRIGESTKPVLIRSIAALEQKDEGTFHGFTGKANGGAIDFIFGEKDRIQFVSGRILRPEYDAVFGTGKRQVSDHFPVEAVIRK